MDTTFELGGNVFNYRVAGVWIENGHILLHKQTSENHWALPGGRAQMLEDSKACLNREMEEELNVQIQVGRLLWLAENFFTYHSKRYHELGLYYKVETGDNSTHVREGVFFGSEGEHLTYQWTALEELHKIQLYPEFLRESLRNLPEDIQHLVISDGSL